MNKNKLLIFLFLIIIPSIMAFSTSTTDWASSDYNEFNTKASSINYGEDFYAQAQNISHVSAAIQNYFQYAPITYDVDSDGNNEIISNDEGIIRIYSYNSTQDKYFLKSEYLLPATMISTPYVYPFQFNAITGEYDFLKLIMYSTSNFYVFNISSDMQVYLEGSKALANPTNFENTNIYVPHSPRCIKGYGSEYCVVRETNDNFEIFNITTPTDIIAANYSHPELRYSTIGNINGVIFQNGIDFEYILPCENGSNGGLLKFYLLNGTVSKRQCTTVITNQPSSNLILKDIDGGNQEIIYLAGNVPTYTSNQIEVWDALTLTKKSGFAYNLGTIKASQGLTVLSDRFVVTACPTTSTLTIAYVSFTGTSLGSITLNTPSTFCSDSDYSTGFDTAVVSGNVLYDHDIGIQRNISGPQLYFTYPSFLNKNFLVSGIDRTYLFTSSAPPLTYANVTIVIQDNQSKAEVKTPFKLTNSNNGVTEWELNSFIGNNRISAVPRVMNVSVDAVSYLPYNQAHNFTAGSYTLYVNLTANVTGNKSVLSVAYRDAVSLDSLISKRIFYVLASVNSSSGERIVLTNGTTTTGDLVITGLNPGNYSLTSSIDGYMPDDRTFYMTSYYTDLIELIPVQVVSTNQPYIVEAESYILRSTKDVSGATIKTKVYTNETCVNDTIFVDFFAVKSDDENFYVRYTCDGSTVNTYVSPLEETETKIIPVPLFIGTIPVGTLIDTDTYTVRRMNGTIACSYENNGTQSVKIWAASKTFNNQLSDFNLLYAQNYAKKIDLYIAYGTTCNATIDLSNVPENPDKIAKTCNDRLAKWNTSTKVGLGILIVLVVSLIVGSLMLNVPHMSGSETIFGISAGFAAIVSIIFLSTTCKMLPDYYSLLAGFFSVAVIALTASNVIGGQR